MIIISIITTITTIIIIVIVITGRGGGPSACSKCPNLSRILVYILVYGLSRILVYVLVYVNVLTYLGYWLSTDPWREPIFLSFFRIDFGTMVRRSFPPNDSPRSSADLLQGYRCQQLPDVICFVEGAHLHVQNVLTLLVYVLV